MPQAQGSLPPFSLDATYKPSALRHFKFVGISRVSLLAIADTQPIGLLHLYFASAALPRWGGFREVSTRH